MPGHYFQPTYMQNTFSVSCLTHFQDLEIKLTTSLFRPWESLAILISLLSTCLSNNCCSSEFWFIFISIQNPRSYLKLQKYRVYFTCLSFLDKVISGFLMINGAWEDRPKLSQSPPSSYLQEGNRNAYIRHPRKQEAQQRRLINIGINVSE